MTFKQWVLDLFKDERGSTSMKPVIGLFLSLCLGGTLIANSFSHGDVKPADSLVEIVGLVIVAMVAGDTLDKFSHKKKKEDEVN